MKNFVGAAPDRREIILVGDLSKTASSPEDWKELARRMARGSVVVFLSQQAFQREKDAVGWLPLAKKGRCYEFNDWLYHKECVAKAHPVFEGLQAKGILDCYYYGPVIPHYIFDGQETPRGSDRRRFCRRVSRSRADMLPGYCWQGTDLVKGTSY